MKQAIVSATSEPNRPDGGCAVILLEAVTPELFPTSVLLASVNEDVAETRTTEMAVIDCRNTDRGLEIVIAPDADPSSSFEPGALVEIRLLEADVKGRFLWPEIAPVKRRKRRNLVVDSRTTAKASPMAVEPSVSASGVGGASYAGGETVGAPDEGTVPTTPTGDAAPGVGLVEPAEAASAAADGSQAPAARDATTAPTRPAEGSAVVGMTEEEPIVQAKDSSTSAAPRNADDRETGVPQAAPSTDLGAPVQSREIRFEPHAAATSQRRRLSGPVAAGIMAAVGAFVVAGAMLLARPAPGPQSEATTRNASGIAVSSPIASQAMATEQSVRTTASLYDVLATGPSSPAGVKSSAGAPLALANAQLRGGGAARNADEGAYWLKRHVTGALAEERMQRALTQLGSLYAEPTRRAPDYLRARQMWELASAAGDPVAMCFLGQLYEFGLGVAVNRASARQWYERSKQAGGCRSVDEALARLAR